MRLLGYFDVQFSLFPKEIEIMDAAKTPIIVSYLQMQR